MAADPVARTQAADPRFGCTAPARWTGISGSEESWAVRSTRKSENSDWPDGSNYDVTSKIDSTSENMKSEMGHENVRFHR